jgi:hypothetical protein
MSIAGYHDLLGTLDIFSHLDKLTFPQSLVRVSCWLVAADFGSCPQTAEESNQRNKPRKPLPHFAKRRTLRNGRLSNLLFR